MCRRNQATTMSRATNISPWIYKNIFRILCPKLNSCSTCKTFTALTMSLSLSIHDVIHRAGFQGSKPEGRGTLYRNGNLEWVSV
jgi:hypothetical protein